MTVLPPIPYYGAKVQMAPRIAALLPPHEHYVEAFAGSLAVLLAKRPSTLETVNDLDEHLVTFWRVVRDNPAELVSLIDATPHSRSEFDEALDFGEAGLSDVERARRVFTRVVQGRMGALGKTGWRFKVDAVGAQHIAEEMNRFRERLVIAADRIRRVQIERMDALDLIDRYGVEPTNLIYADPPYLASTRASVGHYRVEMPNPEQHIDLAEALWRCKATVVLSGYRSDLYDDLYGDWYAEEFPTMTAQGGAGKAVCEVLWSNRPLGGRVQQRLFEV